jgi:hypothetical protein
MYDKEVVEMMNRCLHEIENLKRQRDYLAPQAEAYALLRDVVRLIPKPSQGYGEGDVPVLDRSRLNPLWWLKQGGVSLFLFAVSFGCLSHCAEADAVALKYPSASIPTEYEPIIDDPGIFKGILVFENSEGVNRAIPGLELVFNFRSYFDRQIDDRSRTPAWRNYRDSYSLISMWVSGKIAIGEGYKFNSPSIGEFVGWGLPVVFNVDVNSRRVGAIQIANEGFTDKNISSQLFFGGVFGSFYKVSSRKIKKARSEGENDSEDGDKDSAKRDNLVLKAVYQTPLPREPTFERKVQGGVVFFAGVCLCAALAGLWIWLFNR